MNHISHANEMVVLAPSAKALHTRLNVCYDFATLNVIACRPTMTVCMILRSREFKDFYTEELHINDSDFEYTDQVKYLGH